MCLKSQVQHELDDQKKGQSNYGAPNATKLRIFDRRRQFFKRGKVDVEFLIADFSLLNADYKKLKVDFGFSIIDFRKSIAREIDPEREIDLGKSIMGNRSREIDLGKSITGNRSWKIDLATVHSWLNILEKGRRSS